MNSTQTTGADYRIRCDMCSDDDNCPYDHIPQYPCKTFYERVRVKA